MPRFPRKIVLYSSTKFCILKPWTIISNLIRFDLGFWQASKQIYRKLKYKENVLEEFQRLPRFPRKMVLYSSTKFGISKPWIIIPKLLRFDLGFCQTLKPIYRKIKYREKVFEEFQPLSRFSRKFLFVLYFSKKRSLYKSRKIANIFFLLFKVKLKSFLMMLESLFSKKKLL